MDRNSILGAVLIILILIGGTYYFRPKEAPQDKNTTVKVDTAKGLPGTSQLNTQADTNKLAGINLPEAWRPFARGQEKEITLENEKLIIHVSTKGGRISYAELKGYKTFDGKPLVLTTRESSQFGYKFIAGNSEINTSDLYFNPVVQPVNGKQGAAVDMVLDLGNGKSMHQRYALQPDNFMIDYEMDMIGMNDVLPRRINYIDLDWQSSILRHEKDVKITRSHTTVFYRNEGETDNLSESKDAEDKFKSKTEWVSFKEQFFAQTIIAPKGGFERANISTVEPHENDNIIKNLNASVALTYNHSPSESYKMQLYYGPLHYGTLGKYNLDLERQIPLGWGFFVTSWVNRFVIIPLFNGLSKFISNYGLIILIMTIVIKLIILPFTYKSYLSTAKMKLLKPELDELKQKYGNDMGRMQQEQMKMYRRAGVSPLGGCLPLLFQFPILIAMFRFFPSSIELRQQHFLWAKDLSTYDSIWDFGNVPIIHSIYGDHVSLFTLLMTISTIAYSYMNSNVNPGQNEFKWMSYLMPIFFLGLFNNYSAGLSLYYFLFNILTFIQQYIFKITIDEKKLIAQIEENKRKPASQKKSRFQQRMEDMMRQQQEVQKQKAKNQNQQRKK